MTTLSWLNSITNLVDDLALELPSAERYQRLLMAIRRLVSCDAVALLRLEGDYLVPLAVNGLSKDTLGRRFVIDDHPRFKILLDCPEPMRFPANSPLPDPYDGLIDGVTSQQLEVHDCMGCVLFCHGKLWGLLTLDALERNSFDKVDFNLLQLIASLTVATVNVGERIEQLRSQAKLEQERAESFRLAITQPIHKWIGESEPFLKLKKEIELVANSDLTVLITGETGVGKELVAYGIHQASARNRQPLVAVNCAALPENLIESELFGHVKGAFSGAISDRAGKFEQANNGTLFLDEVGELPLAAQAKLLRVLQNGQLQRVGADKELHVNVRILAATNRDLTNEVKEGRFRADLYHRLSVYPMHIPSLRARGNDILLLAGYFLEQNRSRLGLRALRLEPLAQAALLAYSWPGNVRELEHVIARAALRLLSRSVANKQTILSLSKQDLQLLDNDQDKLEETPVNLHSQAKGKDLRSIQDDFLRNYISERLQVHQNNLSATARELGVNRANLARLLKRLQLRK
ncbi:nitric oxide reductase transcriptional regulator NorR [Entomomonas asaccharolytica]|uniref:Nitric oxide reductase transcriptional regulator NorR n=1 Tax=Entomomonas asaccharolytica TaxID=2785331 RepID=A0A974RWB4_9GAMM|nr:nitric oxide reductase transcriptional regulator NorR [Entomomonas asaccharolytica]QQP84952.1 nitric oxide reductase transcriptional regulator NorR [Entomomonas asaccharolytica]